MSALVRQFLGLRIPVSPEVIVAMIVVAVGIALLGSYAVVLLVGP